MKILHVACIVLSAVSSAFGNAQQTAPLSVAQPVSSSPAAVVDSTPAQQRLEAATRQVEADPRKVQAFNDLATAYLKRARETSDHKYIHDAGAALARGFALDAKDFQLQKTQIAVLLSQHQFAQAKDLATLLNRRTPDDVMTYGYLAEADIALGNYPEAEKSAQWMLNMLPNNIPGLLLGATLRTVYGDPDGAVELLNLAYTETSPTEVEDLAWIANQIASIQIDAGKLDAAAAILERADQTFPRYPYTLQNLARVRLAQRRPSDAVSYLQTARQISPDPYSLYLLIEAQAAAGRPADASAARAELEGVGRESCDRGDLCSRLIVLDANDPATAARALKLAQQQIALRHDVWSEDAYAWALYANGRIPEAEAAVHKAIAVGIQSAQIFDHAGHIALKLGHAEDAAKDFELALHSNPASVYAADARRSLGPSVQAVEPSLAASNAPSRPIASQAATPSVAPPAAQGIPRTPAAFAPVPVALLTPHPTDTDRIIHNAQGAVVHAPKDATGYTTLGAAFFQRARETGDVSDYQSSEQALTQSLNLVSADFSADTALGTMAEVCMGEHRFADALTFAHKALSLGSGDVSPFAIIGDAYADMGEYDKAGQAYARLTPRDMTLSPRAAYARDSRLSYLSFIAGDTAGAIGLMKQSVAEGTEAQLPAENLAWLYYELGEYFTQAGDASSADAAYLAALTTHPGDYRALAALGRLRANNGSSAEAIVLYQKAIAVVPMPIFIAELGDLYAKVGNQAEAKKQYQLVEYIGLLGQVNRVLHNRDLAIFYADHDLKLTEALSLAQKEFEVRHDVYTYDALAWALYKNGRYAEAGQASEKALHFGTRDALLLFHAGMIAEKLGQRDLARTDLKQALAINPHFHLLDAPAAQQRLTLLDAQAVSHVASEIHAQ